MHTQLLGWNVATSLGSHYAHATSITIISLKDDIHLHTKPMSAYQRWESNLVPHALERDTKHLATAVVSSHPLPPMERETVLEKTKLWRYFYAAPTGAHLGPSPSIFVEGLYLLQDFVIFLSSLSIELVLCGWPNVSTICTALTTTAGACTSSCQFDQQAV